MTVERNNHDRDQAVERLLRQSLQTPRDSGVTDACLDAETMAAWADGGLSGHALDRAESHLAGCARCQAFVGTLARTDTAPPPAAAEHPAMRRWFTWLVPLAAAAAVIAIWIAAPREAQGPATQVAEVSQQARADQPTPQQDRALADGRPAAEPSATGRSAGERSEVERPALERPATANGAEGPAESRRDARQAEADSLKKEAEPIDAVASSAQPAAGAAPRFETGTAAPAPPPAEEKSAAAALPRAAENAAAPPPAAARALSPARPAGPAPAVAASGGEIVSPDPSVRWRITGSTVQHSVDGGANWDAAPAPTTAQLTAGSASSASVCWVVGRGGLVLLTTDGRRWRQVAFPEMTDLTGVRARDARSASVTTADGRPFSTTDGGETWVPRPLQGF